jgi:hypothetical protein
MPAKIAIKPAGKEKKVQTAWPPPLDMSRRNVIIYVIGLVVIVTGYLVLSIGPWDSFWSRSLSPLVLLLGYLVIFPIAIFTRSKKK